MRIVVFGSKGMLGSEVVTQLQQTKDILLSIGTDITEVTKLMAIELNADLVINCAGARPENSSAARLIHSNALGPHKLAEAFRCPIIHISTDCVFAGDRTYNYFVGEKPDPTTMYGRSKLLGEVDASHVTNIRTSFIGYQHGFFRWVLDSRGKEIEGWTNAIWSGSTVQEVAKHIVAMRNNPPGGIQHLSTIGNISKYDLMRFLIDTLDLNVTIRPVTMPMIWRGLRPTIRMTHVKDLVDDINSLADRARAETPDLSERVH